MENDMITKEGKLEVFENFKKDYRLPKYQPKKAAADELKHSDYQAQKSDNQSPGVFITSNSTAITSSWAGGGMVMMSNPVMGLTVAQRNDQSEEKKSFWDRILSRRPKPPTYGPPITIQEFFKSIKNSVEELNVVRTRAAGYEKAIQAAIANGQTALVEKLTAGLNAARLECQLEAIGLPKYVEEADVVKFAKRSLKKVDLTWMVNFTRVIPAPIIEKKKLADEHLIFDNYAVMHYDPEGTGKADTKEEIERKKDPILFGLIEDRRRLYFIGDWEDEFCTLTLDDIADSLGDEAIKNLAADVVK
jgi:hypothetical protein